MTNLKDEIVEKNFFLVLLVAMLNITERYKFIFVPDKLTYVL